MLGMKAPHRSLAHTSSGNGHGPLAPLATERRLRNARRFIARTATEQQPQLQQQEAQGGQEPRHAWAADEAARNADTHVVVEKRQGDPWCPCVSDKEREMISKLLLPDKGGAAYMVHCKSPRKTALAGQGRGALRSWATVLSAAQIHEEDIYHLAPCSASVPKNPMGDSGCKLTGILHAFHLACMCTCCMRMATAVYALQTTRLQLSPL
eukprot:1161114-Pelagomonas_calceolata.AAC.1